MEVILVNERTITNVASGDLVELRDLSGAIYLVCESKGKFYLQNLNGRTLYRGCGAFTKDEILKRLNEDGAIIYSAEKYKLEMKERA